MLLGTQAVVAGSGAAPLPEPRAVLLDGVDEYVNMGALFSGYAPDGLLGPYSIGMSHTGPNGLARFVLGSDVVTLPLRLAYDSSRRLLARAYHGETSRQLFRTASGLGASFAAIKRIAVTWAGAVGTGQGAIYLEGSPQSLNFDDAESPVDTISSGSDAAIGRAQTNYASAVVWAVWRIKAELSGAQIAALDAYLAAGDYIGQSSGAITYLLAIDSSARIMAVTSDDDLTGGTGSIAIYGGPSIEYATPINTTSDDLVAVPT